MSPRIWLLTAGAAAIGTSAYIMAGVLTAVERELEVSSAAAGQLFTVFALAYAISAPVLSTMTGGWERRRILVLALVLIAAGNAMASLTPAYSLLMVARVITAFGAALYLPVATLVATELYPPERRARAIAVVLGGMNVALLLGIPVSKLVSESLGYRTVFAIVAAASIFTAWGVAVVLPTFVAAPSVALRERLRAVSNRRVLAILLITVLACWPAFMVHTYLANLLAVTAYVHNVGDISLLLFGYGLGAVAGSAIGGRVSDRFGPRRPLVFVFATLALLLSTLPITATGVPSAAVVLTAWGILTWVAFPVIQSWLITVETRSAGLVLSMNGSAIYVGGALSGVTGGLVIDTWSVTLIPVAAAGMAATALFVTVAVGYRPKCLLPSRSV